MNRHLPIVTAVLLVLAPCACSGEETKPPVKMELEEAKVSVSQKDPRPVMDPALAVRFRASVIRSQLVVTAVRDGTVPVKASLNLARGEADLSGSVDPAVSVVIDLTSFNSDLPERDDRVRQFFFRSQEPGRGAMTLALKSVPEGVTDSLRADRAVKNLPVTAELAFAGTVRPITARVDMSFTEDWHFIVRSTEPVVVNLTEWGFAESLKALIEACGQQAIADAVKVEFDLDFKPVE